VLGSSATQRTDLIRLLSDGRAAFSGSVRASASNCLRLAHEPFGKIGVLALRESGIFEDTQVGERRVVECLGARCLWRTTRISSGRHR
jgi:hypothetical protein